MSSVQLELFVRPRDHDGRLTSGGLVPAVLEERWPLVDLLQADGIDQDGAAWAAQAAIRFGVTRRTVHRWRHVGLSTVAADRLSIRCGLHPAMVWDRWCDAVTYDDDASPEDARAKGGRG